MSFRRPLVLSNALLIALTTLQMNVSAPMLAGGTKVRAPVRLGAGAFITESQVPRMTH
jgi:hypothetical protein